MTADPAPAPSFDLVATYERIRDDVTAMEREIERLYMVEFNATRRRNRLERISEAHHKHVDGHGGTTGDCVECGWTWPCPTYTWATDEARDPIACWNPRDEEEEPSDAA